MNLAIFDVDGTLVDSVSVDAACYIRALAETTGIKGVETEWVVATELSDSGLTNHLFMEHLGRRPNADEVDRLRDRFKQLLGDAPYREVLGAGEFLRRLSDEGWAVGIATGGWRACALMKLSAAGIDVAGLPAAFAEDGESKLPIVNETRRRAGGAFEKVVSFGDGTGDLGAARALGFAFVAVGTRLPNSARSVLDFSDVPRVMDLLLRPSAQGEREGVPIR